MKNRLRMYIVLRQDVSPIVSLIAYGHATLGTYLNWQNDPLMQEWQSTSFVKVPLAAEDKREFDCFKEFGEHRVFTESTLENAEVAIGFRMQREYHQRLRTAEKFCFSSR